MDLIASTSALANDPKGPSDCDNSALADVSPASDIASVSVPTYDLPTFKVPAEIASRGKVTEKTCPMVERLDIQWLFVAMAVGVALVAIARNASQPAQSSTGGWEVGDPLLRVDLNSASAEELALLPDVGPILASRIVATRDERGHFASVEDLNRTPGIGPERLAKLLPFVEVKPRFSDASNKPQPNR